MLIKNLLEDLGADDISQSNAIPVQNVRLVKFTLSLGWAAGYRILYTDKGSETGQ